MNNKSNRRKFLKQLIYSGGLVVLPNFVLGENDVTPMAEILPDIDFLKLHKEAKEAFYRHDFVKAETLFKRLMQTFPKKLDYSDGLRKVYLAQNRLLDACRLTNYLLKSNLNNDQFMDRYAKTLLTLACGNQSQSAGYKTETGIINIFEEGITIYCDAIEKAPSKKYLRFALLDSLHRIERYRKLQKMETPLSSSLLLKAIPLISSYEKEWSDNRIFKPINVSKARSIAITEETDRRPLYFEKEQKQRAEHILSYQRTLQLFYFDMQTGSNNGIMARKAYVVPSNLSLISPVLMEKIRKEAKRTKDYTIQAKICQSRYDRYPLFWNIIALADVLRTRGEVDKAIQLYILAERKMLPITYKKAGAVYGGWAMSLYQKGLYNEGKSIILKGLEAISGVSGVSISLCLLYVRGLSLQSDTKRALEVLLCLSGKYGLSKYPTLSNDPISPFILPDALTHRKIYFTQALEERAISKEEKIRILYSLALLYKEMNDFPGLNSVRDQIMNLTTNQRILDKMNALI